MKLLRRPGLRPSSSDKLHDSSCSFQALYHLNSRHLGSYHFLVAAQKFLKTGRNEFVIHRCRTPTSIYQIIPVGSSAILVSASLGLKSWILQPAIDLKGDSDDEKVCKQQLSTRPNWDFGSNKVQPGSFSLFALFFFLLYASRRFLLFSSLCSSVIAA